MSNDPHWVYNSDLDAFTLYHQVQESHQTTSSIGPALPALGHAVSGALGSAVSKSLLYPLDLVITRLQVQKRDASSNKQAEYDGIIDAFQKIYEQEGGVSAFYSGLLHDTVKSVADAFLFFLAYDYLHRARLRHRGNAKHLPALDGLGVGMLAGAFSKLLTTPIQNVVTRKQTAKRQSGLSTAAIVRQIRDEKGVQGFWSGYSASLVLTLNPALTMLFHETFLRALVPRAKRQDPGARITFLAAAASKALASTITYPFSLAKARAQASAEDIVDTHFGGDVSKDESLQAAQRKLKAKAKRNTVFWTIAQIAKTEGIGAMYRGVEGEVLKGFLTHGFTMMVKERIHGGVVQLYYLIIKALKASPSPEKVATMAKERARSAADDAREGLGSAATQTRALAESAMEKGKEVMQSGEKTASKGMKLGGDMLSDAATRTKTIAENSVELGKSMAGNASEQAQHMYEKGKEQAENVYNKVEEGMKTLASPVKEMVKPEEKS